MFRYDRMNALFAETGVKKAHVIRLMGKSSYYLRDAEKLNTDLHPKYVKIIADALGTTPEYLTGETDEKKPLVNNDEELTDLLERVRDDPDLRMLFSVTKGATKEDIQRAIKIIQMLKNE